MFNPHHAIIKERSRMIRLTTLSATWRTSYSKLPSSLLASLSTSQAHSPRASIAWLPHSNENRHSSTTPSLQQPRQKSPRINNTTARWQLLRPNKDATNPRGLRQWSLLSPSEPGPFSMQQGRTPSHCVILFRHDERFRPRRHVLSLIFSMANLKRFARFFFVLFFVARGNVLVLSGSGAILAAL